MFDQILQIVKDHLGNNPQLTNSIPVESADAVHQEIAAHITNGLKNQAETLGGTDSLISSLKSEVTSGHPVVNLIEGGLISSLASKFGLPPAATGAISAALPGLLQKFAHKTSNPNDRSLTPESVSADLSENGGSGNLGNIFKNL
ncbi:MAG: hypothetical protein JWQ63_3090 [Mucilaginibacter sp.]|nr:hypothetical protein [Mucilaginibacter sp.]